MMGANASEMTDSASTTLNQSPRLNSGTQGLVKVTTAPQMLASMPTMEQIQNTTGCASLRSSNASLYLPMMKSPASTLCTMTATYGTLALFTLLMAGGRRLSRPDTSSRRANE